MFGKQVENDFLKDQVLNEIPFWLLMSYLRQRKRFMELWCNTPFIAFDGGDVVATSTSQVSLLVALDSKYVGGILPTRPLILCQVGSEYVFDTRYINWWYTVDKATLVRF